MSDATGTVVCREHGTRQAAFVCQHLVSGRNLGFHYAPSAEHPDDPCPDAWCDRCEQAIEAEGGWNHRSLAAGQVTMLCDRCYEAARARNWRQDENAYNGLLMDAMSYLQRKQTELRERYRISEYQRYHWNQETAQLVFSELGQAKVVADIQFVGSFSIRSATWLWSWANESFLERVRTDLRKVRKYGDDHRFLRLAAAHWDAAEQDGWEMTAVSAFLLGAQGAYRSPGEHDLTFMLR